MPPVKVNQVAKPPQPVQTQAPVHERQPDLMKEGAEHEASMTEALGIGNAHSFGDIPLFPRDVAIVQPKLSINEPGDRYEQEADRMAEQVVGMHPYTPLASRPMTILGNSSIQRACAECEKEKEEEEGPLMRKAEGGAGFEVSPLFAAQLNRLNGNGSPLEDSTRHRMEQAFSADFSRVRVHTGTAAADMSRGIRARAFTHGQDIYFNEGEYDTGSKEGQKLLAHELTHTLQQADYSVQRQAVAESEPSADSSQPARLVVEDSDTPAEGQMSKTEFLRHLNEAVCTTVNEELEGTPYSSDNCPYIRAIFTRQADSTPSQIEQLAMRYEPQAASAQSAEELIGLILVRVRSAVQRWKQDRSRPDDVPEDVSGLMSGGMGDVPSSAGDTDAFGEASVQFKAKPGGAQSSQSPQAVMQRLGMGSPLDGNTRSRMEGAFGTSFGNVEVHTDSHAAGLASGMNARAFAVGNHIAFGSGEFKPGTLVGDALVAHELAHVVQQGGADASTVSAESHLESDADKAAFFAVSNIWQKGKMKVNNAMPTIRTGIHLSRCDLTTSSRTTSTEQAPIAPIEPTVVREPAPFTQTDTTSGATLGSATGHTVRAYYFQGTSNRKALILGGVHGSEPGGVEVVNNLLTMLRSPGAPTPYFSVVIIPELFSANIHSSRPLAERRTSGGTVRSASPLARNGVEATPDPNRQFPAVGANPSTNPTLGCVVDEQNRCVEPENLVLLDLINRFQPERVANVHGHSAPVDRPATATRPAQSVRDVLLSDGGPSITTDPRPGHESEDDALTLSMAREAHRRGVRVPGNFIGTGDQTTRYPTGTAPRLSSGVSFGAWGSHSTPSRPAMNIVLIETFGNRTSADGNAAAQAARRTELMNIAEILRDFFLVDPSSLH